MAPLPEETSYQEPTADTINDDDIVITGMSGLFPQSHSVLEFYEKIYKNENLITSKNQRWNLNHPEVSDYHGNVPGLERFDAQFFMIHYRLGNVMDCMTRKLMENSYQAVYDAGYNPIEISGRNIGVYLGSGFAESEKVTVSAESAGFGIIGCNRAMFANRISFCLNAKGPSMIVDAACAGSFIALENAYDAIKRGECEAAVVAACSVHLHPHTYIHYDRFLKINPDGKTKSFDKKADGISQSEAIAILFLQKYKDARRVYAKLCHAKSEFQVMSYIDQPLYKYDHCRPKEVSTTFLKKFYKDANVAPEDVEYVEAFGIGIPEADKDELEAIEEVFCNGKRKKQLLVGSVMSQAGYADAASGIIALTKMLLAYHKGLISASLNCDEPRDDIKALTDGRMRIVTANEPFNRSYVALNNVSYLGHNAHALLKGHFIPRNDAHYKTTIPYLVTISGRQESAVETVLKDLKSRPINPEEISLFHHIHRMRTHMHMARGFTVLSTNEENETVVLSEKVDYYDETKHPLWFVYSGMGSQWVGMGAQLMKIPLFARAIHKCHDILVPKGLDLIQIITGNDKTTFDNIINCFVGIAAIQIGITDILTEIGIVPDKIIGHSVGELGCAYADGCFSLEEMILAAYCRGLVSVQTPLIKGSMAAVGVGYKQIKPLCPPEIEVACHNGPESCTISGPADKMKEFVATLTAQSIFAKEVPCSNIAYHSRYIKDAGPNLLKYLKEVIPNPKERSSKWVSTSVSQDKWALASMCSAEYHTNNLLSPVLFEETSRLIPPNAVTIEIAPHGLLQAILKRSLPQSCTHIPLTRRGHADNSVFLLEAIGKIYMHGYDPDLRNLYPKVQFPVATETRPLSHLVEWMHNEIWCLPFHQNPKRRHASACDFFISFHDDEYEYLRGHTIDEEIRYPFAGILVNVWNTLAMTLDVKMEELSVVFKNIYFYSQPKFDDDISLKLTVEIQRGTGDFEVTNNKVVIVKGTILNISPDATKNGFSEETEVFIDKDDVYRMLYVNGYQYSGEFQTIESFSQSCKTAKVKWANNWITFLDSLIQINLLRKSTFSQLHFCREINIDVKKQTVHSFENDDNAMIIEAKIDGDTITCCGGVSIEGIRFKTKTQQVRQKADLRSLKFVPNVQSAFVELSTALYLMLQIVAESINTNTITAFEIFEENNISLSNTVKDLVTALGFNVKFANMHKSEILDPKFKYMKPDVIMLSHFIMDRKVSEDLYHALPHDAFVIVLEEKTSSSLYKVITSIQTKRGKIVLAKWRPQPAIQPNIVNVVCSKDLLSLYAAKTDSECRRLIVCTVFPLINGLKDLINKYRKDNPKIKIQVAAIEEKSFEKMKGKIPDLELTFNVYMNGTWGGEYLLPSEFKIDEKCEVILKSPKDGQVDSLRWVRMPDVEDDSGVDVTVHYSGLSHLDAKKATGEAFLLNDQHDEHLYGMDYSGTTKSGARVMGLVKSGSAASHVRAESNLLWPVPKHWSLEDAATVPLAYAHAFYCLGIKSELIPGMSILVHGATGGLGQAVINIALAHNCEVFATVSNMRKKRFLRKLFPEIPEKNIGHSRDNSFVDMIIQETDGKGCNVVVSCLKGNDLNNATIFCGGFSAITIDTHSLHSRDNFHLGLFCLFQSRMYKPTDFSSIFDMNNTQDMKKLQLMVSEGIARGYVKPLSRVIYSKSEIHSAIRLLAASRHRGRVIINMRDDVQESVPRISIHPNSSHLVITTDDDTMFSVCFAEMLLSRGAKNLIIHYLSDHVKGVGHATTKCRQWLHSNLNVQMTNKMPTTQDELNILIHNASQMGNLEGIYVISNQEEVKDTVVHSLVHNLDVLTRKICPNLKKFLVMTRNSDICSNICIKRASDGYPASKLNMGSVKQYAATNTPSEGASDAMELNIAIDLLEMALKCSDTQMVGISQPVEQSTIIEEVFKLPGLFFDEKTHDNMTLQQLGINQNSAYKLTEVLEERFNILLSRDSIPMMTLSELKLLQENLTKDKRKVISGLDTFFTNIETDELHVNVSMVHLNSLVSNCDMRDDEFDNSQTHLILIPGFGGVHTEFTTMAERLKLPTVVCQPGFDNINESIEDMAERLAKDIIKRLKPKEKFYLLGYSFGSLVAMEIASILEKQGLEGVIFCVDADPETFPKTLKSWLKITQISTFQNKLIEHMYRIMSGEVSKQLNEKLEFARKWQDKLDACIKHLQGKINITNEYARLNIEMAYSKIEQTIKYDCTKLKKIPLNSQIVLLRSRNSTFAVPAILEKYSRKPLRVYELKNDHARALQDVSATNIVNTNLDSNILESFSNKNLCSSYLLNAIDIVDFTKKTFE